MDTLFMSLEYVGETLKKKKLGDSGYNQAKNWDTPYPENWRCPMVSRPASVEGSRSPWLRPQPCSITGPAEDCAPCLHGEMFPASFPPLLYPHQTAWLKASVSDMAARGTPGQSVVVPCARDAHQLRTAGGRGNNAKGWGRERQTFEGDNHLSRHRTCDTERTDGHGTGHKGALLYSVGTAPISKLAFP